MKEILPDIFAIEVPEDAENFKIIPDEDCPTVYYEFNHELLKGQYSEEYVLPPGSYEILFTTKDCSEEQAGSVVERIHAGGFGRSGEEWKIYDDRVVAPRYATESLQSLLRSHNLTGKNYLLIKRQP